MIHMFSHVRLSWDSLGYIFVRFSKNCFVILMLSNVCLLCVSPRETIMRFLKKFFAVYMNSHGIILGNYMFSFKWHWIHVSIICTTLVKWNCCKCPKHKLHTYWFCFAWIVWFAFTHRPAIHLHSTKDLSCAHIISPAKQYALL